MRSNLVLIKMYKDQFSKEKWSKLAICLFCSLFFHDQASAQNWSFNLGTNLTSFDFKNTSGQALQGIKAGSGSTYSIQYTRKLVDTTALLLGVSPKTIFLNQRPKLAKLLSKFYFGGGIQFNQFNTVGDAVNVAYSYQTDYVGIGGSFQFLQPIYKNTAVQVGLGLQVNQLIHGNQWVNNQYLDLRQDKQFNSPLVMGVYQLGIVQKISDGLSFSLNYQLSSSLNPIESNKTSLSFKPSSFLIGITYQPLKNSIQ